MTEERLNGHKIKRLHTLTGQRLGKTLEQLNLTPTQSHVLSYLVEHRGAGPLPQRCGGVFLPDPSHGLRNSLPVGGQGLCGIPAGSGGPAVQTHSRDE